MNVTDIVILVFIVLSGLLALIRGFVKEVLSMAAWVGAAFVALPASLFPHPNLFDPIVPYFRSFITIPYLPDAAAFLVVFVVALILLSGIGHVIASRVHQSNFSALDKSLGLLLGLLRGAVLVCLAYLLLASFERPDEYPPWIQGARSMPLVERGAQMIRQLIPESAQRRSAAALGTAESTAQQGLAVKKAYDELTQPKPKADAQKEQEGYNRDERREMDRVIQSTQ